MVRIAEAQPSLAEPAEDRPTRRRRGLVRAGGAVVVWLTTTLLALAQLFVGGMAGLADNGDATRLVCRLGLQIGTGSSQPTFESSYGAVPVCPAGGFYEYRSSWRPVWQVTVWLWQQVTGDPGFDVAALGVVCSVLLGAAVAALFLALPGGTGRRAVLCGLVAVAACDIGFVSYFNSGYSDPAGFIGLVFVCAGLVGLVTRRTLPWLVVMVLSLAFVSTAKTQLVTAVVVAAVVVVVSRPHWARRSAVGRWGVPRLGLTVGVVLALVTALAGVFAKGQGASFSRGNKFNMLFYTILPDSPDPAADLREMGLPASLARFSGTGAWEVYTPYNDPEVLANQDRIYSWATYVEFLAHHPDRLVGMARRSFDAVLGARVDYLGNLPGVPGGEVQRVDRPSPVFWLFEQAPSGWPVPVLSLLWVFGGVLGLWWLRSRDVQLVARGVLLVTTSLYALSQALVVLSDGYYELAKHDVHAAFATGLLLAVLLEAGVGALWGRLRRRTGRAGSAAPDDGRQEEPGSSPGTGTDVPTRSAAMVSRQDAPPSTERQAMADS